MHRATCLSLLTNAVIAWITVYIAAAIDGLRIDGRSVEESDLTHMTALQALAKTAKFEELGAVSLHLLRNGLYKSDERTLAESVLRSAQQRQTGDVWVN